MALFPSYRRVLAVAATAVALVGALVLAPFTSAEAAPTGAPPACSVAEGNARYVRFVYLEILERCPDGAGLAYWTGRLDAGVSRWAFAETLDTSTENLGANNVDLMFPAYLGRPPTVAERDRWITQLRNSHENATLTATLLASYEGYDMATTAGTRAEQDQQWLTRAYNRILDRAPNASGLSYYTGWFSAAGSTRAERFKVAMALELSTSNATSWVKATMTEALGRTPDAAGVAHWVAWLQGPGRWQTFRLWTHQLASNEAYRHAQTLPS